MAVVGLVRFNPEIRAAIPEDDSGKTLRMPEAATVYGVSLNHYGVGHFNSAFMLVTGWSQNKTVWTTLSVSVVSESYDW